MAQQKEQVTTICYGHAKIWNSREEAIAEFLEGIIMSEGSEKERYSNILSQLITGKTVCSDEN